MPDPSLFPMFMNPLGGGTGVGGGDLVIELLAEPIIELEPDLTIEVQDDNIDIELESQIEVEIED